MSRQIQIRRGSATEHETFTGAIGEVTMDTTNKTLRVHDGTTVGGIPLARADAVPSDITNKMIPDYANGIAMNMTITEQTYTCPSNGVVVVDTSGFNWVYGYIKINGVTLFNVTTNGNSAVINGNGQFIVGTGDVITYKSGYVHETVHPSTNKLTFFPFRS